jgi:hypothetical protein
MVVYAPEILRVKNAGMWFKGRRNKIWTVRIIADFLTEEEASTWMLRALHGKAEKEEGAGSNYKNRRQKAP